MIKKMFNFNLNNVIMNYIEYKNNTIYWNSIKKI